MDAACVQQCILVCMISGVSSHGSAIPNSEDFCIHFHPCQAVLFDGTLNDWYGGDWMLLQ